MKKNRNDDTEWTFTRLLVKNYFQHIRKVIKKGKRKKLVPNI